MSDQDDRSEQGTRTDHDADEEEPPTEPRESESGQRQPDADREGSMDAGADHDERGEHPDADAGETDTHGGTEPVGQRSTAPQSDFTTRQVGIGVAVLAVGSVIAFALPLLLA